MTTNYYVWDQKQFTPASKRGECADRETWTLTTLRWHGSEPCVSTNSTISAYNPKWVILKCKIKPRLAPLIFINQLGSTNSTISAYPARGAEKLFEDAFCFNIPITQIGKTITIASNEANIKALNWLILRISIGWAV